MQQIVMNIRTAKCPNFDTLKAAGYVVRELYMDGYLDGVEATKTVNNRKVHVYVGSDDGDIYFTPQAMIDDERVGEAATPEKAARMAEFRAMMPDH